MSAQHAGVDADVGNGLGECEGAAPGLAIFTGLGRGGETFVAGDLLRRAALVDGGEGEKAGEAGGGCSAIDPCELEGSEREREILGAGDESAFFGLHEGGGDAGAIEGFEHLGFGGGPLVGVALSGGDHVGDGGAGDAARRLDEHLQVESVGETPLDLTHRVAGKSEHGFCVGYCRRAHLIHLKQRTYCPGKSMSRHVTRITSAAR